MTEILGTVLFWLVLATCCSIAWDLYTYEDRQLKWERAHPGDIYIPGYEHTVRKQERLKKKNGMI